MEDERKFRMLAVALIRKLADSTSAAEGYASIIAATAGEPTQAKPLKLLSHTLAVQKNYIIALEAVKRMINDAPVIQNVTPEVAIKKFLQNSSVNTSNLQFSRVYKSPQVRIDVERLQICLHLLSLSADTPKNARIELTLRSRGKFLFLRVTSFAGSRKILPDESIIIEVARAVAASFGAHLSVRVDHVSLRLIMAQQLDLALDEQKAHAKN